MDIVDHNTDLWYSLITSSLLKTSSFSGFAEPPLPPTPTSPYCLISICFTLLPAKNVPFFLSPAQLVLSSPNLTYLVKPRGPKPLALFQTPGDSAHHTHLEMIKGQMHMLLSCVYVLPLSPYFHFLISNDHGLPFFD